MLLHPSRDNSQAGNAVSPVLAAVPTSGPLGPGLRQALQVAVSNLDAAESRGQPSDICQAMLPVAQCYRQMGAWAAAENLQRQALRLARTSGAIELLVDVLCELAETACGLAAATCQSDPGQARAARDRARDEAFEAATLTHRSSDAHWAAASLLRIGTLLERCGDHDDAARLQTRARALVPLRA